MHIPRMMQASTKSVTIDSILILQTKQDTIGTILTTKDYNERSPEIGGLYFNDLKPVNIICMAVISANHFQLTSSTANNGCTY